MEGDKPSIRNTTLSNQARSEGSTGSIQWFKYLGRGNKANQCCNRKALVWRDGEYLYKEDQEEEEKS
ncbi:unnamed protein product [Linum trigynum]|uniref:Uncharacterized protein n=1 Tax=Linum trigynum TaxID=586398 RepID=A0AAV2FCV1_9ROSI